MQYRSFFAATLFWVITGGCTSNEIGNSKDVAPETIYQQYSINYTEGDETAEVYAQFRFGGKNGTTLVLNPPSGVSFDGQKIRVDSAGLSGAFYKAAKPVGSFFGSHHWEFTDISNKTFRNTFVFDRIGLQSRPAEASTQSPLRLVFDTTGLKTGDEISISSSLTDSSFTIVHTVNSANPDFNTVTIPLEDMKKQKSKKIVLDISLNREVPLQQNTKEGGILSITYRLKPVKLVLVQ